MKLLHNTGFSLEISKGEMLDMMMVIIKNITSALVVCTITVPLIIVMTSVSHFHDEPCKINTVHIKLNK